MTTHALHVAKAAPNTATRAQRILELVAQVQRAESVEPAARLDREVQPLSAQLVEGEDAAGSGRVGWQKGEGGLATARQHLNFLMGG